MTFKNIKIVKVSEVSRIRNFQKAFLRRIGQCSRHLSYTVPILRMSKFTSYRLNKKCFLKEDVIYTKLKYIGQILLYQAGKKE